ncbi:MULTISPECIES: DUF642 domain-containing protein [unclassified Pseudomonas]|uniref:DUF642 domain-containing protein n=1 Tax=unclassified Pseudomonas TaxID=196821 RepID=UPI0016440983|nr:MULTISPECIES: DUF642 domain-containing protein [unclassified Pseudomonas]MBC3208835.1 DUF642 domain-containing protein [Pseudomonas sp. SWRI111]MBC3775145.1 DUF642 domain-containing protein [Pseudomonas sp. SWRI99]
MLNKKIAALLATFALLGSTNALAANLLVNGSFEQSTCGAGCILDTPAKADAITGWTTFLSGAEYFNMPNAIGGSVAADGVMIVDLANYVYGNGGGIQQNFATTVGAKYRLTFSAGNSRFASRAGDGVVQVKVAGQTATFNTPTAKGVAVEWATITYDFTATTTQTTLAFSNEQNPNANFAFIDNVIVERL